MCLAASGELARGVCVGVVIKATLDVDNGSQVTVSIVKLDHVAQKDETTVAVERVDGFELIREKCLVELDDLAF